MGIVLDTYTTTPTTTTTHHMAQWESARLEAEARLSQESLLSSASSSSAATNATNSSSLPSPPNPSPVPVDFFLRIWNSPTGDAFRKPVTSTSSCATAPIPPPPPPHTSPLLGSNVTTSNEATGAEEITSEEEEEEDSYRLYFDFAAGDDLGFFQGQMGSCCYSSLLADLNEASLDTAFK